MAETFDVFELELTATEINAVDSRDTGRRGGPEPDLIHTNTFPLKVVSRG